jgi:hypothetical protein
MIRRGLCQESNFAEFDTDDGDLLISDPANGT